MNYLKLTIVLLFACIINVEAQVLATVNPPVKTATKKSYKTKKIKKNSIAVLPSYFILEEDFNKANSLRVQSFILDFLRRKKRKFNLVPINKREINASIFNSNLSNDAIHNMDVRELCKVLGTEYVMVTEVSKVLEGVNEDVEFGIATNDGNIVGAGQKNQRKEYVTNTNVWLYNKNGDLVYENSIRPFSIRAFLHFENEDWKAHVRTLIKKMPQYK